MPNICLATPDAIARREKSRHFLEAVSGGSGPSRQLANGCYQATRPVKLPPCLRVRDSAKLLPVSVFGAVSTTVLFGDFLSGCLVLFASLFMVFTISLEIEIQRKGKK